MVFGGVGAGWTPAERGGGAHAGDLSAQLYLIMHEQLVLCLRSVGGCPQGGHIVTSNFTSCACTCDHCLVCPELVFRSAVHKITERGWSDVKRTDLPNRHTHYTIVYFTCSPPQLGPSNHSDTGEAPALGFFSPSQLVSSLVGVFLECLA